MKTLLSAAILAAAMILPEPALAQVTVTGPWVRATVPSQMATGAFMTLTAPKGGRLVEAKSPVAGVVEIHEMVMDKDVMRMRAVAALALPAGKAVALRPGGYHVMLMSLQQQIREGDRVPLTLVVEGRDGKRETIEVTATARPLGSARGDMKKHH